MSGDDTPMPLPTSEGEAFDRLRETFDAMPAAVALLRGPHHVFEFANPAYLKLVNGRRVEGLTVDEALPEVRQQGFIDLLDRVYATGERFVGRETKVALLHDDGIEELFVDFIYQPIRGATGEVEAILAHAVDVTEGVRAREQLAEALRREQEDRFRRAIDSMIDTVLIALPLRDGEGRIVDLEVTFVNSGDDELGRRTREQLIGRRFTELWPNLEASGLLARYIHVVETGEPLVLEDFSYSDTVDETEVGAWFDIRATSLGDDLILAFRDVTDRVVRERALAESRARLVQEHEAVVALQAAILPREVPTTPGADVAAEYVAATEGLEVGGDWFDVFVLPEGRLAISVGDVAGKGLHAAQVMAQLRTAGRVAVLDGRDPAAVLTAQNALMITGGLGPFATSVFAVYDAATGELAWSYAGHLPPLHVSGSGAALLPVPERPPLGVVEHPEYLTDSITLGDGERVVLYTDGLVERRGESLTDGLERLRTAVPADGDAAATCRALLDRLGVAAGGGDDVCVLTLVCRRA